MVYDEYSDDIKNTYAKMTEDRDRIADDRFYKYFYNLLETGSNYCDFSFARLVKSVDEKWVTEIEKALPSLQAVVLNPRKFIEEEREVVNIAIARNISTESVRHLLAHSNFIDEYNEEEGTVVPNRILNVYKEESLNTYENRFICTLVAELQFFVNKRFDIVFQATKDELGAYLELNSLIDNYTEMVEYKLQVKIRDKQTDKVNENEKDDILGRIIKIHRMINSIVSSEFITTMRKFPGVKHPIVKTNAIAKNRDYKACHTLWNFIHSYSKAGVSVDLLKQDPTISRKFEKDLYDSVIWNYTMLHNYLQDVDALNINRPVLTKDMSTDYIRQVLEEIIQGMSSMPDAALRKLIQNEMLAIQTRRKMERKKADKTLKKRKKTTKNK
jgi:hypothetical protein